METNYPKGTTKEQWDRYDEEVKAHQEFIKNYKFFLDRIVNYLDWQAPRMNKVSFTPSEIKDFVSSEILAASSCDAPNKPGYTYANND
jgi:hypothetical protein